MAFRYEDRYEQIRYLAGGEIGEMPKGAMSEVVYVEDTKGQHKSPIVLKRPVISDRSKEISPFEDQNRALEREIIALELLNKSNFFSVNIPKIISSGKHPGRMVPGKDYYSPPPHNYLIMTYASGLPLDKVSPVPSLIAVFNSFSIIIGELKKIHEIGIIYNDARDHHIIWDKDIDPIAKNPKSLTLVDFGNAFFFIDPELAKYNVEIYKKPQPIDDFQQLGGSLYKLITGKEFSDQNANNFNVKPQYEVIGELIDNQLILKAIQNICQGNINHAQEELVGLAQMLEQEREIYFARLERKMEISQIVLEEEWILDERTLNVVSYPTLEFSNEWNTFINEKEFERSKSDIRDNIQNEHWARILDQDVQKIGNHNKQLGKTIKDLVAITLNQSIENNEIYQEQISILLFLLDEKHEEATNAVVNFISELKEIAYESIIPFLARCLSLISKNTDKHLIHYDNPVTYKQFAHANSPNSILKAYEEISKKEENPIYIEIIENLGKAINAWEELDLNPAKRILSERIILKDTCNLALHFWRNSIIEYKRWLGETQTWPSSIPEIKKFSHPLLEKISKFEEGEYGLSNIYDQLNLIDIASDLVKPKLIHLEARQSFIGWEKKEKDRLYPKIIDEVQNALETEHSSLLSEIQDREFPLTKYLSARKEELLGIIKSFSALSEYSPDNPDRLQEVTKEIKIYKLQNSRFQEHWNLIEAAHSYLKAVSIDAPNLHELALDFQSISQHNRERSHWLYQKFIIPAHLQKSEVDSLPQKIDENTKEASPKKIWQKLPKPIKIILSIVVIGIFIPLGYLILSNASNGLEENGTVEVTQQVDMPISNPDAMEPCETILNQIIQGIEYDSSLFNAACNNPETRQLAYDQLVTAIRSNLSNNNYPPQFSNIILQISDWEIDDSSELVHLGKCGQFLAYIQDEEFIESRNWIDNNLRVNPDVDWPSICGWDPLVLHIEISQINFPYIGDLVFAEDGTVNLFDGLIDSSYQFIPKSYRLYTTEILFNINPISSPYLIINETTIPDQRIYILSNTFLSLNLDFPQRIIKIDWLYTSAHVEISYRVYAPINAVTALVKLGDSYTSIANTYNISLDELQGFNENKRLVPNEMVFLINPNSLKEIIEGEEWYVISDESQVFDFSVASLSEPMLLGYFGQDQIEYSKFSVTLYFP